MLSHFLIERRREIFYGGGGGGLSSRWLRSSPHIRDIAVMTPKLRTNKYGPIDIVHHPKVCQLKFCLQCLCVDHMLFCSCENICIEHIIRNINDSNDSKT